MPSNMGNTLIAALVLVVGGTGLTATADAQRASGQRAGATSSGASSGGTTAAKRDAQAPNTGFSFGVYTLVAPGLTISGPDVDGTFSTSFGQGLGVSADYGFNSTFSGFASLDLARQSTTTGTVPQGTFGLAHLELGVRANFRVSDPRLVPYVSASVGRRALAASAIDPDTGEQYDAGMSGEMMAIGGGIKRFLSPTLALDAGLEVAYGSFGHWTANGDVVDAQVSGTMSTRLRAGLIWHP